MHRATLAFLLLLGMTLSGCGEAYHPARGAVHLSDGAALPTGQVIFIGTNTNGEPVTARGYLQQDGKFELGTTSPQGGVPEGTYKMIINVLDLVDIPHETLDLRRPLPFHAKYLDLKKSDLEFTIQRGQPNVFDITLDAPPKEQYEREWATLDRATRGKAAQYLGQSKSTP